MAEQAVHFEVIDESEDWIAINKPAGLLMHPTKPGGPATLWDGLRQLLAYEVVNKGQVSLINRLDRETSGVVLVCKNAESARLFGMAMQEGRIKKTYEALVYGWPGEEEFSVNAPLLRIGEKEISKIWLKRGIHPDGDVAETKVTVTERRTRSDGERFSRVTARPVTGRTHQIRVHLASVGHAVIGDKIYGPDENLYLRFIEQGWNDTLEKSLWLPRHALHSKILEAEIRGESHRWEAGMPEDMAEMLRTAVPAKEPDPPSRP